MFRQSCGRLPFLVPVTTKSASVIGKLTSFDYFSIDPTPDQISRLKEAAPFTQEMELAFFVVHFGMSKRDFLELTETEKAFIRKEFETHTVTKYTHYRNAMYNALANSKRKKRAKFIELFTKRRPKANKEYNLQAVNLVKRIEEKEGKNWVAEIYRQNGLLRNLKKGRG